MRYEVQDAAEVWRSTPADRRVGMMARRLGQKSSSSFRQLAIFVAAVSSSRHSKLALASPSVVDLDLSEVPVFAGLPKLSVSSPD